MTTTHTAVAGRSHHSVAAIAMIVFATALFASMDATAKYLGAYVPLVLALLCRYAVQAGTMAAWIARMQGRRGFRAAHPRFQLLRGALLVAVSALAFYSVQLTPLAEFTAIIMLWPILATTAAGWFFGEKVGALRWALVWGGFVGTLIVIRPGAGLFGWEVVMPLATMVAATGYNLITSRLAVLDDPYTTQFYTGVIGTAALAPLVLFFFPAAAAQSLQAAPAGLWALLLLLGVFGTVGHLLIVMAFGRAGTATLMPFTYAQIAFAALLGWLVFRHVPDVWAWLGIALISVCGAATAWLNVRDAQRAGVPPAALEPAAD
ncbi:MAG TPA: DMT family transporter [Burkholderiaceae bacterium]|nr:DMT family transporter [Burkholderiaceae bacterium]